MNEGERLFVIRFARGAAVAGLCVTIARVLVLSGMLGGDVTDMWDLNLIQIILEGTEGRAAIVRAIGLIAIAAFSFGTSASQAAAVLGAFATAGSFALTGHTGSIGPWNLPRILLAAHVLAVSYWIGALVPLFKITASPEFSRVGAILKRFGNIAALVVPGLIAAGLVLLWLLLGSLEAIFTSTYGRLVLLKLAFVAGLLMLAAINKLRLTSGVTAGDPAAVASLRWSITGELGLAAIILVVTATFTTVVGPPELE